MMEDARRAAIRQAAPILVLALVTLTGCSEGESEAGCPEDLYCQHESLREICESAVTEFAESQPSYRGEDLFIDLYCQDW